MRRLSAFWGLMMWLAASASGQEDRGNRVHFSFQSRVLPLTSGISSVPTLRASLLHRGERTVLSECVARTGEWTLQEADFSSWAGQWVTLELEASCSEGSPAPVSVGWRSVRVEVNTGGRPEPTADVLGTVCWGYASVTRERKMALDMESPMSLFQLGSGAEAVPILRMEIPQSDTAISVSLRVPLWIPDALPGALETLDPNRFQSLWTESLATAKSSLSAAASTQDLGLRVSEGISRLSWGLGLPGIPGCWALVSQEGEVSRIPLSVVGGRQRGSHLSLLFEGLTPAGQGLSGSVSLALDGDRSAEIHVTTDRVPSNGSLQAIEMLLWLYGEDGPAVSVMASPNRGRLLSVQEEAPWATYLPGQELPILLMQGPGGAMILDWPQECLATLGPLGSFCLASGEFRGLQSRQLAMSLKFPSGNGRVSAHWFPGSMDWIESARQAQKVVRDRFGDAEAFWRRPHLFVSEAAMTDYEAWGIGAFSAFKRSILVSLPEGFSLDQKGGSDMTWRVRKGWRSERGSDKPFSESRKVDVWAGPGWSAWDSESLPVMDLLADKSWTIVSHPANSPDPFGGRGFVTDLLLGREGSFFIDTPRDVNLSGVVFERGQAQANKIPRPCILTQPPPGSSGGWTVASWPLSIPDLSCRLKGFTGIADEAPLGDGAGFRILVDQDVVLDRMHREREWSRFQVDLSPWRGMEVLLSLAVGAGPAGDPVNDWALWGDVSVEDDNGKEVLNLVDRAGVAKVAVQEETNPFAAWDARDPCRLLQAEMGILDWTSRMMRDKRLLTWDRLEMGGVAATYEDGIQIHVSGLDGTPIALERGTLGRSGFAFESPQGQVMLVKEWDGRRYARETLFSVRSLDGRPWVWSKKVRVSRVFGDAVIRLRSFRVPTGVRLGPSRVQSGKIVATGDGWYEIFVRDEAEVQLR